MYMCTHVHIMYMYMFIFDHCFQIKTFKEYVQLYLKGQEDADDENLPRSVIHEVVNERWEICLTASDSGFQQASFVNSIATTKVSTCKCIHVHCTHTCTCK